MRVLTIGRCFALVLAVAAALAPATVDAAILDSVTSGSQVMPNVGTATSITLGSTATFDISRAFVICWTRTTNQTPNLYLFTCDLNTSAGNARLTITPTTAPGVGTTTVYYYVAQFAAGVSVQRGSTTLVDTNLTPATAVTLPTAVDCTKSFVLTSVRDTDTSSARDELWTVRAMLATGASPCTSGSTTSLELSRNLGRTGTTVTLHWQVVTMEGATVQRGTSCIGGNAATPACATASGATNGTSNRVTLGTAVDTSKTFILTTRKSGSSIGGVEGEHNVRAEFLSTGASVTGLQFVRSLNATANNHQVDIAYEVVSLGDGSTVQSSGTASTTLTGTTATTSPNLSTVTDTTRTVLFYTSSAGDNNQSARNDDTMLTAVVNGSNAGATASSLTFQRGSTTNVGTNSIAWFAVSFFRCTTASGIAHDTLCTVGASTTGTTGTVHWSSVNTVLVLGSTASISATPVNGTTYTAGQFIGGVQVVYSGSSASDTFYSQGGLTTGVPAYGKIWAKAGPVGSCATAPCYVGGVEVSLTPRGAPTAWSAAIVGGGAALNPAVAGSGGMSLSSNNGKITTVDSDTGAWSSVPAATHAAVQGYLSVFPFGGDDAVVGGDQGGWVYSINPSTGAYNWLVKLNTDAVQAAVSTYLRSFFSPQMTATYPGSYDIIFAATSNTNLTNNKVFALRSDTGATLWTFDPATLGTSPCASGCPMDQVVGQPWVDYSNDRLYIGSRPGSGGTQNSLWSLNLRTSPATLLNVLGGAADYTTAPGQSSYDQTLYVGDEAGLLHIVDLTTFTQTTNAAASGTAFKGFVWEDFNTQGRLYFVTTDGNVWCLQPPSTSPCWTTKPVASGTVSQMLISDVYAWVGGSNGTLYQLSLADGSISKTFVVGAGGQTLGPVTTETGDELFVAASDGTLYKIALTAGSLP